MKLVVHNRIRILSLSLITSLLLFTSCHLNTDRTVKVSAGWNLGNQLACFANGTTDGKITSTVTVKPTLLYNRRKA